MREQRDGDLHLENDVDNQTLEQVLISLYSWARKLALALELDKNRAEDLVQEVMVRAIGNPPRTISHDVMKSWIRTTMTRLIWRTHSRILREAKALLKLRTTEAVAGATSGFLMIGLHVRCWDCRAGSGPA